MPNTLLRTPPLHPPANFQLLFFWKSAVEPIEPYLGLDATTTQHTPHAQVLLVLAFNTFDLIGKTLPVSAGLIFDGKSADRTHGAPKAS